MSTCGTHAGRTAHQRRGEKPCDACAAAYNKYTRELRLRSPYYREQADRRVAARRAALERLARENPERFKELVADEMAARPR